jgi:hypothetical protein
MAKRRRTPAEQARDLALSGVEHSERDEWRAAAYEAIRGLTPGAEMTGEQIREAVLAEVGCSPHHHNVWGAIINGAARQGLLEDTGRRANMTGERSHARRTPIYCVGGNSTASAAPRRSAESLLVLVRNNLARMRNNARPGGQLRTALHTQVALIDDWRDSDV